MIRKRKGFAILLSAMFSLGMLGGIPAYAEGIPEETIQQDIIGIHQNDVERTDTPDYVEGEAIVCYKAEVSEIGEIGKGDLPVIDQEEEESLKQEAEETLEAERCVDEAEALLLVGDVGEQIISEEETEEREALPGVITLVQSDHLTTEELIAELSERDDVLYAEPNYIQTVQSDDLTDRQWGENSTYGIGVENWNSYSGDAPAPAVNTSGLVVAVLDTGVDYTHEDLRDVMWDDGLDYPELVQMGGGAYGYNSAVMRSGGRLYDTTDPMDDHHHGTHCAGIIAASWNGMGVSGVTSGAKIMAIKVGNEKGTMMADAIIRGFQYVIAAKKAGVNIVASNHSYGGTADSITEGVLVEEAGRCGIVCVYAAGNDNQNIDLSNSAASFLGRKKNALIVGASTSEGEKASFSNYGSREVDVFAPGYDIWSTYPMKTGTPTEESKIFTVGEKSLFVDYSTKDTIEDEVFGFSGVNCSLKVRTASDERNTLCAELDEPGLNIGLLTNKFEDLTDCFGGVIGVYTEQEGSLGFSVYEVDSEGRTEWIGNGSGNLTPGLNQIGFLYPKKAELKRKNIRLRIMFGRKDSEGNVVPQLDIRQFRLTSDGGNYDVLSGTSMAAPMVTG